MSLSLSLFDESDSPVHEPVPIYRVNPVQDVFLNRAGFHSPIFKTKKSFEDHVKDHPINPMVTGAFAFQYTQYNNGRNYRCLPLALVHDAYVRGDINFLHEMFLSDVKVKPFFDIDIKREHEFFPPPENRQGFLNRAIGHLSDALGLSSDHEDWTVIETGYEDGSKVSFHLVCNDGTAFRNFREFHFWTHKHPIMWEEFGFDTTPMQQLRIAGSSKWEVGKPKRPAVIRGVDHWSVTFAQFCRSLVTYIPEGFRLMELSQPELVPNYADPQRPVAHGDAVIDAVLRILEEDPRNDEQLVWFARNDELQRLSFKVENFKGFGACDCHEPEVVLNFKPNYESFYINCHEHFNQRIGIGSPQREFFAQAEYLLWLSRHNLDRVDVPLFEEDFGRHCMTVEQFFNLLRDQVKKCGNCGWCLGEEAVPSQFTYFSRDRRGNLCSLEFFDWLRGLRADKGAHADDELDNLNHLAAYINCFYCRSQVSDCYYTRGVDSLLIQKAQGLTTSMAGYMYWVRVKSRRKNEEDDWTLKPFWQKYISMERGLWTFHGHNEAGLDYSNQYLNMLPKIAVDTNAALKAWREQSHPNRKWLIFMWKSYLGMCAAYELESEQNKAAVCLQRWVLETMFDVGRPKQIAPLLLSEHQGQGKSTLGNLIMQVLGPSLSCSPSSKIFFESPFNYGTNGFVFLDELKMNAMSADRFKEALTAPNLREEAKGANFRTVPSRRSFLAASNNVEMPALAKFGHDRRFLALRILSRDELDKLNLFKYDCGECYEVDQYGDEIPCGHLMEKHADWAFKFYTHILTGSRDKRFFQGDFFLPFIGMLKELFDMLSPTWKLPLQATMPMTKAAVEMQQKGQSLTIQWMEHCIKRGYHSHFGGPLNYNHNKPPTVVFREADIAEMARIGPVMEARWLRWATISQLHFEFLQWHETEGIRCAPTSKEHFEQELKMMHRDYMGYEIATQAFTCRALKYTAQYGQEPDWKGTMRPDMHIECLDMGERPWERVRVVEPRAVLRASAPLLRSESENQLRFSPEPVESTLGQMEYARFHNEERPILANLMELVRDDEDARFPHYGGEEEDVDEDEQDRRAAAEDDANRKRRKAAPIYIDGEADESDREDSDSDLLGGFEY